MLRHRTFKGNLYELVLQRHRQRRAAVNGAIACLEAMSNDLPLRIVARIGQLKGELGEALTGVPDPEWANAIGLTANAEVDKQGSESFGDYTLAVVPTDGAPYFKCLVTGPKGVEVWWPGCGHSETETMVRVGAWRHTIRRFFGLEARGGS